MWEEVQDLIKHYASHPLNNYEMEDATVKYEEWNIICDDSIQVFLKINDDIIEKYSYTWDLSIVWLAAASILVEEIEGKTIDEILWWDYEYIKNLWFEVSARRKRASVLPILAIRNAIHQYKQDGIKDDFDDLGEWC